MKIVNPNLNQCYRVWVSSRTGLEMSAIPMKLNIEKIEIFHTKKGKMKKKASKPVYELEGAFGLTKDSDPTRVPEEGKVSVRDVSPRLCFILFFEF